MSSEHPLDEVSINSSEAHQTSIENDMLDKKSAISDCSYEWQSTHSGMSQDEVRKLVSNALKMAREATRPKGSYTAIHESIDEQGRSQSKELLDNSVETENSVDAAIREILNVTGDVAEDDGESSMRATETSFSVARDMIHEEFSETQDEDQPQSSKSSKRSDDDKPTGGSDRSNDLAGDILPVSREGKEEELTKTKGRSSGAMDLSGDPTMNEADHEESSQNGSERSGKTSPSENPWAISPQVSEDEDDQQDKSLKPATNTSQPRKIHPRQVQFKDPYPTPTPLASPRPSHEIIQDNKAKPPNSDGVWSSPTPKLQELIVAARGDSLSRRANALGALKVLSLQKKNQLAMARTVGLLDALLSAVNASFGPENAQLGTTARARAVVSLLHLSEPKHNRDILMAHPGLCESLVRVLEIDDGEARAHACGALAMLAKTASNREQMVQKKNLVSMLASIVKRKCNQLRKDDESSGDDLEQPDSSSDGSSMRSLSSHSASFRKSSDLSDEDDTKPSSCKVQKDGQKDEFARCARYNACAALAHLSKQCFCASILGQNDGFLKAMMSTSVEFESKLHTRCIEILCNLTRFPANNEVFANTPELLETLVVCVMSRLPDDRLWALRAFQNISSDSAARCILATTPILTVLSTCAVETDHEQQVAAVAALYNISTDADAVVPITNTRTVVATLIHLAHDSDSPDAVRRMSCDALATIGLWLQKAAESGTAPEGLLMVPLPSHTTSGWRSFD